MVVEILRQDLAQVMLVTLHEIGVCFILGASRIPEAVSGAILAGSSSLSGKMDLLDWQHSCPQQFNARAAEHGPLESFSIC
jgi:hypothetical protein